MAIAALAAAPSPARRPDGRLELTVVDADSGEPIPARIHLRDGRGRTVKSRGWGHAALGDHAYLDGPAALELRKGPYRFDLDAGPEYRTRTGHFTIERHADDTERIEMRRFADLAEEGWLGADLLSARSSDDLPLLLRASQTAFASSVGYRWEDGEWAPLDRRAKGLGADALWTDPRGIVWLIDPSGDLGRDDLPPVGQSSTRMLHRARDNGWFVAANPTSWELPVWLACGVLDGVVVIDGWAESKEGRRAEAAGRTGDRVLFPGIRGAGRWREHVYHQIVRAGFDLVVPIAGSGSGLCDTPFADARVYANASSPSGFWESVRMGEVLVTNGPLVRADFHRHPTPGPSFHDSDQSNRPARPGDSFNVSEDEPIEVEIALKLATRDPVDYLEIIKDGQVEHSVRLSDFAKGKGRLPKVRFSQSGWLAIRAVTDDHERYRFATTTPFWISGEERLRPDPAAIEFFAEWLEESAERFESLSELEYGKARLFWRRLAETND